jgi:hypothetical protein
MDVWARGTTVAPTARPISIGHMLQDDGCVVVREGCAATAQEHDTCADLVFPRLAWAASVDDVINAISG